MGPSSDIVASLKSTLQYGKRDNSVFVLKNCDIFIYNIFKLLQYILL